MKDIIVNIVKTHNGIREVDLALKTIEAIGPSLFDDKKYMKNIEELVQDGKIRELQFFLISTQHRIRSIYFSADTAFLNRSDLDAVRTDQTNLVRASKRHP